jgi:hypothetical protein
MPQKQILFRLPFFKYIKEKVKESLSLSGKVKGDIFLNPNLKSGQDILREGRHDDHIIHAIRHFSGHEGYAKCYIDLNAGFGAIAAEIAGHFQQYELYEADEMQRAILSVNMTLKASSGEVKILSQPTFPVGRAIVRCERAENLSKFIKFDKQIIIFQNREAAQIETPYHDVYLYSAHMDKARPFKTLWRLITRGYAFDLTRIEEGDSLKAADYILLPKGQSL